MKNSNCYNCGGTGHSFYAKENGFNLVKCNTCGLLFVEHMPNDDQISQSHKQGKHAGSRELDSTGRYEASKVNEYLKILRDLFKKEELNKKSTWLDVGCGYGEFMIAVQSYSSGRIIVKGTEPNIHKRESAQKRGVRVDYFDLDTHEEKYDVLSLLNVYSHLPNPPQFFETLKKLLNPGGILIVQTGDTANLSAKEHFRPFYLPDHLSFASEKIVVEILERLNFEVVCIKKYPFVKFDLKTIVKEFVKIFIPRYQSKILYSLRIKKVPLTDMFIVAKLR